MNSSSDTHAPAEIEEGTHLLDYVKVVRRRWQVALLVFLLVFCGVAVKTWLAKPVYEASVTLKVDKNSRGDILNGQNMESLGFPGLRYRVDPLPLPGRGGGAPPAPRLANRGDSAPGSPAAWRNSPSMIRRPLWSSS